MVFREIVDITPQIANSLLFKNANSRPVNNIKVQFYANKMTNGSWNKKNYVPIQLDSAGNLINGQHRLLAILKSGKTIKMKIETKNDAVFRNIECFSLPNIIEKDG